MVKKETIIQSTNSWTLEDIARSLIAGHGWAGFAGGLGSVNTEVRVVVSVSKVRKNAKRRR